MSSTIKQIKLQAQGNHLRFKIPEYFRNVRSMAYGLPLVHFRQIHFQILRHTGVRFYSSRHFSVSINDCRFAMRSEQDEIVFLTKGAFEKSYNTDYWDCSDSNNSLYNYWAIQPSLSSPISPAFPNYLVAYACFNGDSGWDVIVWLVCLIGGVISSCCRSDWRRK